MCLNREPLRRRGALYPQSLGPLNHRKLRNYAASDHTHLMGAEVREHPGGTEGFRADVARDFDLEIAGTSCGSLIVSDEHFHSALATRQEIQRLADFLRRCCKSCQVIIYLRRQDELSRSFHSEQIKIGTSGEGALFPPKITYYYDYRAIIENYESVFGVGNLSVRRFERARLANADVIDDFAALTGIGDIRSWPRPPRRNVALDGLALHFLAELNRYIPQAVHDRPNPDRADLRPLLEANLPGEGWPVSRQKAIEFYRMFAPINEWVRQRFFADDATLFHEDFSRYPESEPEAPQRFADAVAVAAMLWRHQANAIRALRHEVATMRAERGSRSDGR